MGIRVLCLPVTMSVPQKAIGAQAGVDDVIAEYFQTEKRV